MNGNIHSVESFGTVDGPGIRYVVFTQGCPMRCQYCHNPDTWKVNAGISMSTDEILANYEKNRSFYKGGGLTVTGGEPLLQLAFVTELFEKAQAKDIHTCLDTSGITFQPDNQDYLATLNKLLAVTNLVMLDIKHIIPEAHKSLTGHSNEQILNFARYLDDKGILLWVRHVVVPSITDQERDLEALGYFLGGLKNLKALDALPYHTMGISKYEQMGMTYPLVHLSDCSKERAMWAKSVILQGIRRKRVEN